MADKSCRHKLSATKLLQHRRKVVAQLPKDLETKITHASVAKSSNSHEAESFYYVANFLKNVNVEGRSQSSLLVRSTACSYRAFALFRSLGSPRPVLYLSARLYVLWCGTLLIAFGLVFVALHGTNVFSGTDV
jgi:hypothetical protein